MKFPEHLMISLKMEKKSERHKDQKEKVLRNSKSNMMKEYRHQAKPFLIQLQKIKNWLA